MRPIHYVIIAAALLVGLILQCNVGGLSLGGGGPAVVLDSGRTVKGDDIQRPLVASIKTKRTRGFIILTLRLTDSGGRGVRSVRLQGDKRPKAPRVEIYDEGGEQVYSCQLSYG